MLEINLLDVAIVVVLLVFLARGLLRGLTREVGGLVGVICGFALARRFQTTLEPSLETLFANKDVAGIIAFVLIFLLTLVLVTFLFFALRRFMSITLTLWIDHFLGGIAGLAKGLLILTFLFFLVQGFFPHLQLVENAQSTPILQSLADYLREFLPDAFTLKLPARFPIRL